MSENKKKKINEEQKVNDKAARSAEETAEETAEGKTASAEPRLDELETLELKLEESEKKAEEYKQSWYRSAAEFENYRKRHANERAQAYADGQADVIKSVLVIGDNLERAMQSVPDEKTAEGIAMMIRQFAETLANLNVKAVDPVGEIFDPNLHEAVHQVEAEDGEESGRIKSVFRKGYELGGKILRYAQVVVIK